MSENPTSLKVGLIGLGAVAEAHLAGAVDVKGAEVVAAAEINPERLAEMTARWNVKGYSDAVEMIEKEALDIVCVLTPALTHREITALAAERGVHVLCEKPMAVTLEDCRTMIADCESNGVVFGYGSTYRFLPAVRKAKEIVDAGEIGDVLFLTEHFLGGTGPDGWHEYGPHHYPPGGPGGGGMGIVDHGIHLVDIFTWLTGSEVETVVGRGNLSGGEPQTEFLTMLFASGAVGQLFYNEITFPSDLPSEGIFSLGGRWTPQGRVVAGGNWDSHPLSIRVHGTEGALRVFPYANRLFHNDGEEMRNVPLEGPPMPGNFTRQLEAFAECVRTGGEPEATGMDGLRSLAVVLAAYRAFDEKRYVSPDELLSGERF